MLYSSAQIGNFPVKLYSLTILVSLDILLHHPARPLTTNSAVGSFRREVNVSPRGAFLCHRTLSGKSSTPDVEGASHRHWRKLTLVAFQTCAYAYGDADYGDDDLMRGCIAWERKIEASKHMFWTRSDLSLKAWTIFILFIPREMRRTSHGRASFCFQGFSAQTHPNNIKFSIWWGRYCVLKFSCEITSFSSRDRWIGNMQKASQEKRLEKIW